MLQYCIFEMQQESQMEYDVQTILDKAYNKKQKKWYYLVKWQNYPIDDSTWEPFSQVQHLDAILKTFNEEYDESFKGKYPHGIIPFWEDTQTSKTHKKNNKSKAIHNAKKKRSNYVRKKKNKKNDGVIEEINDKKKKKVMAQQKNTQDNKIKSEVKQQYEMTEVKDKSMEQIQFVRERNTKIGNESSTVKVEQAQIGNDQQELKAEIIGMRKSAQYCQNYGSRLILQPFHNLFEFLIQDYRHQESEWVSRSQILKRYPVELCLFYQKHVQFQST